MKNKETRITYLEKLDKNQVGNLSVYSILDDSILYQDRCDVEFAIKIIKKKKSESSASLVKFEFVYDEDITEVTVEDDDAVTVEDDIAYRISKIDDVSTLTNQYKLVKEKVTIESSKLNSMMKISDFDEEVKTLFVSAIREIEKKANIGKDKKISVKFTNKLMRLIPGKWGKGKVEDVADNVVALINEEKTVDDALNEIVSNIEKKKDEAINFIVNLTESIESMREEQLIHQEIANKANEMLQEAKQNTREYFDIQDVATNAMTSFNDIDRMIEDDITPLTAGASAVIHKINNRLPTIRANIGRKTNVQGSQQVFADLNDMFDVFDELTDAIDESTSESIHNLNVKVFKSLTKSEEKVDKIQKSAILHKKRQDELLQLAREVENSKNRAYEKTLEINKQVQVEYKNKSNSLLGYTNTDFNHTYAPKDD